MIRTERLISTLGLVVCMATGILHSVEVAYPLLARRPANNVLPFIEPGLPEVSKDQLTDNK